MATVLKIPSSAFAVAAPLEQYASTQLALRIPVSTTLNRSGAPYQFFTAVYGLPSIVQYSRAGTLLVSVYGVTVDNTEFTNAGQAYKNSVADLIAKGWITVTIDGVSKTAAQVRAL